MAQSDARTQTGLCLSVDDLAIIDRRAAALGATRSGYIVLRGAPELGGPS